MRKVILFCVAVIALFATRSFAQPGPIIRVAGVSASGYNGEGIVDTLARFSNIVAFCKDASGNMYVADQGCYRIRKIDAATHLVTTIAGSCNSSAICYSHLS